MQGYSCPACESDRVLDLGHSFACCACGYQEKLTDYREALPLPDSEAVDFQPQIDALSHLVNGLVNQAKPKTARDTY